MEAAIRRIEALNPGLNAVVTPLYDRARAAARQPLPPGPFAGVPYLLKDLIDLEGTRKTAGSRLLVAYQSTETHAIVARAQAAGLVVLGKTNTPEFAFNGSTEPLLLGATHNPWDVARSAGGSSGGAAAAVAAGMVPMAHASDGGGSIRIPASCCGLFGLKPSRERMVGSRASDSGVEHCVSWSVRDSARLLDWTQRREPGAPLPPLAVPTGPAARRLRIAFSTRNLFGNEAADSVKAALEQSARLCAGLGHQVELVALPVQGEEFYEHFMVAWSGGAARVVQMAQARGLAPESVLEPWTLHLAAHAARQDAQAPQRAAAYFRALSQRMDGFFRQWGVALTPVVRTEPPPLGHLGPQVPGADLWARLLDYVSYTPVHNAAGTPAMSVPLGTGPTGLPIGSQFAARVGAEDKLLALAFELEQAAPWAGRSPPRHA